MSIVAEMKIIAGTENPTDATSTSNVYASLNANISYVCVSINVSYDGNKSLGRVTCATVKNLSIIQN